jgi:hypothetical protein
MLFLESQQIGIEDIIFAWVNPPGYVFSGEKQNAAVARKLHGNAFVLHQLNGVLQFRA